MYYFAYWKVRFFLLRILYFSQPYILTFSSTLMLNSMTCVKWCFLIFGSCVFSNFGSCIFQSLMSPVFSVILFGPVFSVIFGSCIFSNFWVLYFQSFMSPVFSDIFGVLYFQSFMSPVFSVISIIVLSLCFKI